MVGEKFTCQIKFILPDQNIIYQNFSTIAKRRRYLKEVIKTGEVVIFAVAYVVQYNFAIGGFVDTDDEINLKLRYKHNTDFKGDNYKARL